MSYEKQINYTEEPIRILIRIRPFFSEEETTITPLIIDEKDDQSIKIGKKGQYYEGIYDKIFFSNSTQKEIFDYLSLFLNKISNGINFTIISYGQTGTGKTYTIFGKEWTNNANYSDNFRYTKYDFIKNNMKIIQNAESNGIVPRMLLYIFNSNIFNDFDISCSFMQIYNEKIYDLLGEEIDNSNKFIIPYGNDISSINPINQKSLEILENKKLGIFIQGLSQIVVNSLEDCINILIKGEENRKKRQTNKNELSSRSHILFIVKLQSKNPDEKGYIKVKYKI
jgi:hypothetical protein